MKVTDGHHQDSTSAEQRRHVMAPLHQQTVSAANIATVVLSPRVSVASTVSVPLSHSEQQPLHRPPGSLQLSLHQSQQQQPTSTSPQKSPSPLKSPSLGRLGSIHPPSQPSPLLSPTSQARRSPVKYPIQSAVSTTPLGVPPSAKRQSGDVFFPPGEPFATPSHTLQESSTTELKSQPSQSDVPNLQQADGELASEVQSELDIMQQLPGIAMGSSSESDSGSSSDSESESEPPELPYQQGEESNFTAGEDSNLTPYDNEDFVPTGEETNTTDNELTFSLLQSDNLESLDTPAQVLEGLDIESLVADTGSEAPVTDTLQLLEEPAEQMAPTTDLSCLINEGNDEPSNYSLPDRMEQVMTSDMNNESTQLSSGSEIPVGSTVSSVLPSEEQSMAETSRRSRSPSVSHWLGPRDSSRSRSRSRSRSPLREQETL